jgi:uncharacterized protein (TIGR03435 family)
MVQNLLKDRFGFSAHKEQREMSTYALMLARKDARLGPQLKPSNADCAQSIAGQQPLPPSAKRPTCGTIATRRFITAGGRTMAQLAVTLQSMVGEPVVDQTGLTGAYDLDLSWAPPGNDGALPPGDAPSIFTAVQEQLGLKLIHHKDQVEVLVIDKVERPTVD